MNLEHFPCYYCSPEEVQSIVTECFNNKESAQGSWPEQAAIKMVDRVKSSDAGVDDITVWVIPLWYHLHSGVKKVISPITENEQVGKPGPPESARSATANAEIVNNSQIVVKPRTEPDDTDREALGTSGGNDSKPCRACTVGCMIS